ncbi:hypothetical protein ACGC1H_001340 [Rhizoctonia solani]|uniref:BTB domain-containing protein n=1 Tax=Rhizoctonia solani TaxID=456999 RepID=A0A8H3AII7_9AGAM|nr:unnamed protein product [Rhizoctonia solani]
MATLTSTNNRHSLSDPTQPVNPNDTVPTPSSRVASTVHDFTGTLVELQANDVVFKIPEARISKFTSLHQQLEDARRANPQSTRLSISVRGNNELVTDLFNTFKLLSTSSIEEPVNPNTETLVSAARISAAYGHPTLYTFCIERLEGLSLSSIERLHIARALSLSSWEEHAYKELSEREEMITKEEASLLGFDAYFQVASMRENRLRSNVVSPHSEADVPTEPQTATELRHSPDGDIPSSDDDMGFGLLFD